MAEQAFKCPKCNGEMVKGFVTSQSQGRSYYPAYWVEGEPVNMSLFGLQAVNLDISGKKVFVLRSLRCSKCGFTELYSV